MIGLFQKDWTAWDEQRRSHAQHLAAVARIHGGPRGERLRRKIVTANAREFKRRGVDKLKGQKALDAKLAIHAQHMALLAPEEQTLARAAFMAHALEHQEGPVGQLTPAHRDLLRRKVNAERSAAKRGKPTPMPAVVRPKLKRTSDVPPSKDMTVKRVPVTQRHRRSSLFAKYNQEHDEHGQFTGPGGSHDPTGNPRGRPANGTQQGPTGKQQLGQAGLDVGFGAAGGYAGSLIAGAAGAALGGPVGAAVGSTAGKWAGSILGSLAGDYVATKIGQTLLGIKEQTDGHAIGEGQMIGTLAGAALPLLSSAIPGGNAVAAGARSLFSPTNFSLASHLAEEGVSAVGGAAGRQVDNSVASRATAAAATGGKAPFSLAAAAQQVGYPTVGGYPVPPPTMAGTMRGGFHGFGKSIFDNPPKSYDGSFTSMSSASLPHVFGPRAWKKISDTPFGSYVRQKVKEAAEKMDDAADAKGIELKPAKPAHIGIARGVVEQARYQQAQAEQQMMQRQAQQQQAGPGGGATKQVAKLFSMPMRMPNDAVARDAYRTGGAANVKFLRMMQETDRKSRQHQLRLAFHGPKEANLAPSPGEDERAYRDRLNDTMKRSVEMADRTRMALFNGGEAGQRPIYRVKKAKNLSVQGRFSAGGTEFHIQAEFAKGFNTEDKLKQGLLYGWASIIEKGGKVVTDHQNDRIEEAELVKAAHDYVTNSRAGGVLHDKWGHEIGHVVESVVFTHELQKALGVDLGKVGWLIGFQISDPKVKMLARAGVLKAFSIGGKGRREEVEVDDAA